MTGNSISDLSLPEKKILEALKERETATVEDLLAETKLSHSTIARSFLKLDKLGLIRLKKSQLLKVKLTKEAEKYVEEGLPEKKVAGALLNLGEVEINELVSRTGLPEKIVTIGLGLLRKKSAVEIRKVKGKTLFSPSAKCREFVEKESREEKVLKEIRHGKEPCSLDKEVIEDLKRRGLVSISRKKVLTARITSEGVKVAGKISVKPSITLLSPSLITSGKWRECEFKKYDVISPVKPRAIGRRHPLTWLLNEIRRIWLEMGFKEVEGPLVELSFWCFDALYQPQDHPARELADTLYLANPDKGELPSPEIVKRVKETHENGWKTGSKGWRYKWDHEEARSLVLRTHTTSVSARMLAEIKPPARIFSIGKVYRRENLDPVRLHEFYQVEGIVVSEEVTFRDLLGYLKIFFSKLGFRKVRFRPGYFPYTEMSVEPEVYDGKRGKWIELGGAGIFRPEVVMPLLNKDVPVLAWGLGPERLLMNLLETGDIRFPYKNNLKWLRETPQKPMT